MGDKLSTTMYYTYLGPHKKFIHRSRMRNECDGNVYIIDNDIISKNFSSTQFTKTGKVSKTAAVRVLQNCASEIFEACFATKKKPTRVLIGRRKNPVPEE